MRSVCPEIVRSLSTILLSLINACSCSSYLNHDCRSIAVDIDASPHGGSSDINKSDRISKFITCIRNWNTRARIERERAVNPVGDATIQKPGSLPMRESSRSRQRFSFHDATQLSNALVYAYQPCECPHDPLLATSPSYTGAATPPSQTGAACITFSLRTCG